MEMILLFIGITWDIPKSYEILVPIFSILCIAPQTFSPTALLEDTTSLIKPSFCPLTTIPSRASMFTIAT